LTHLTYIGRFCEVKKNEINAKPPTTSTELCEVTMHTALIVQAAIKEFVDKEEGLD
jgi:hypothetical protein